MPHANARLTVRGRLLLVRRVREQGWAVAHAAKAMGISRQCAHRWLARYDQHGVAGLGERSSRPHSTPRRTPPQVEEQILACRDQHRRGQDWIAGELGLAPRTVGRVLRRAGVPHLSCLDPMTGEVIRSSKATAVRYERERPGELVHVDVKKLGKIPDGGGWRAHGRAATVAHRHKAARVGYDYVHSMVDDHSRLAYSEIHDDEKVDTCAGFLTRAAAHCADHGIPRIERVMTDNAFAYRHGRAFVDAVAAIGAVQKFIKPHCPWQNGKVERFNRTLQTEWAYRYVFTSNQARRDALAPWLNSYNTERRHSALGGLPPTSRVTNLMAEYT
ncbi:IS481 family transposase [Ornithinimicrobium cerasi]|uniref:IS481 family transposase n=1 Tax=Ornithinimicrobium cerasi TaxID=2248773 RepID=UPI000F00C499|nr:IS481 family transposase [Ornithinimicrobium cerasi]